MGDVERAGLLGASGQLHSGPDHCAEAPELFDLGTLCLDYVRAGPRTQPKPTLQNELFYDRKFLM